MKKEREDLHRLDYAIVGVIFILVVGKVADIIRVVEVSSYVLVSAIEALIYAGFAVSILTLSKNERWHFLMTLLSALFVLVSFFVSLGEAATAASLKMLPVLASRNVIAVILTAAAPWAMFVAYFVKRLVITIRRIEAS